MSDDMKKFRDISILHISDLHKNDGDDFGNLLQSMKDDCDRYVNNGIIKPNIIVVSGDLIRGGKPEEIKQQYDEVKAFLEDLTAYFIDGDKNKIVIVPGNHDVDWNVSKDQMKPLDRITAEEKSEYKKKLDLFLKEKAPRHRWSWNDQTLYSYSNDEIYNSRFAQFSEFYQSFYSNRIYSLNPSYQYDFFEIPEYNICFVGFNSCYLNDHLNKVGQIYPTCVTKTSSKMKEMAEKGRILVAVWHHNASGRPMVNNYLDNRILNPIIDMGVHIALHGHQHYSGVVEEYHNAFKDGKLLMFSTGSLYGATETLSYGAPRQYNILELTKEEEKLVITVHLREDKNSEEFGIPNWGKGRIKEIGESFWRTNIQYPVQPIDEEKLSELMNIGMETGDYSRAIEMLKETAQTDDLRRKMMLDLMLKGKRYRDVIDYIGEPMNDEDACVVVNAAFELDDREVSQKVKEYDEIKNSTNTQIKKMRDYL